MTPTWRTSAGRAESRTPPAKVRRGSGRSSRSTSGCRIYQIDDLAGNSALGPDAEANPAYGPPARPAALAKRQARGRPRSGALARAAPRRSVHSNLMGSNGLAVGSEDATNGGGVVLANPHFPWHGSERFWEMNVEVPGKYHATGAGIWGLPGINIGHNQNVAWTHTVSTNTTVTFWVPVARGTDQVLLRRQKRQDEEAHRDGRGSRTRRTGAAHRHPLLQPLRAGDLGERSARSRSATPMPTTSGVVNQWLAISKAENASQVIESERAIQGVPWVNTIGADDRRQRVLHGDRRGLESDEGLRRLGPATSRRGRSPARSWATAHANCPKARVRSCRASLRAATSRR